MTGLQHAGRQLRVGHGRPVPGDEWRVCGLHRTFTRRWPLCVIQEPLGSLR